MEQKNKMADKMKMAAMHEFSKSTETWDLERKNLSAILFFILLQ
jgi:hypothetical protein